MESTIIIHWDGVPMSNMEKFPIAFFEKDFVPEWLQSDFFQFCIKNVDKCEYLGGILINSPILGPIPPSELSGSLKTLVMAHRNPDKIFPLHYVGNNCGEAIFRSAIERPTQWEWGWYSPDFLPEQRIQIATTGEIVLGKDWTEWYLHKAPRPEELYPEDFEEDEDDDTYYY